MSSAAMDTDGLVKTRKKLAVRRPKLYAVVMHNDDFTPMEFVVMLLKKIFQKKPVEAHELMRRIHEMGSSLVGRYPYDIAVTKVTQSTAMARQEGHPLKCSVEEVE